VVLLDTDPKASDNEAIRKKCQMVLAIRVLGLTNRYFDRVVFEKYVLRRKKPRLTYSKPVTKKKKNIFYFLELLIFIT
jgi:hypothetical protein